jgi:hypothetical protein
MTALDDILVNNDLHPSSTAPGRYYTICPRCSAERTGTNQRRKVLGITIDDNGVRWFCNHCGWHGGGHFNGRGTGQDRSEFAAIYPYFAENGELLFEVCRTANKEFPQRAPNGHSGYIWTTKHIRKVLFRLPELLEAVANEHLIVIVEGEKDVLNLARIGVPATCNPGGAAKPGKKPKWCSEFSEVLRGADIVIIADHDEPGYAHAAAIAAMSFGIAKRIRVLKLAEHWRDCPEGGDVSDWLKAGHTREQLDWLIEQAPDYVAQAALTPTPDPVSYWHWHGDAEPIDARSYLVEGLLPETGTALISGQWGTYKTFVADDLAASVMTGKPFIRFPVLRPGGVLWVAREGWTEVDLRITAAWEAKGGTGRAPFAWIENCPRLLDANAAQALGVMIKPAADKMLADFGLPVTLVIIDTVGKAAGLMKTGELNDDAVAKIIMKTLADASLATGALFAAVAHFGKNVDVGTKGSSGFEDDADVVLALLGDKGINGVVEAPRLCARKRRSGPNGEEFGFRTRSVDCGLNKYGNPETTLILEWLDGAPTRTAKPQPDPWRAKSLRLLRQTLMNMLADCGKDMRPYADGPVVRAVEQEIVRAEFYKSYPAEGDDKAKKETRRKALLRALTDAQGKELIGIRDVGTETYVWLTAPAQCA